MNGACDCCGKDCERLVQLDDELWVCPECQVWIEDWSPDKSEEEMASTTVSRETLTVRRMRGRTTTGDEWDKRDYWHATDIAGRHTVSMAPALCGARPGRYSTGWSQPAEREVTCPECQRRLRGRP